MHIVTLFRDDPDVISIGTRVFRFQCLVMPTFSVAVFSNMFFQAVGKSWRATILAISRPGFLIPMSFLLTGAFGLTGLELAQPTADLLSFIVGRLAFAAGLMDREQAITPTELIPLFDWGKIPKKDLTISM